MLLIVLIVLFTVVMLLWFLSMLPKGPVVGYSGWLAFFAVLLLSLILFSTGSGVATWRPS